MITIKDLHLQFGGQQIFDGIHLTVKETDKIGLIGRNGVGKTSLFRILANEISSDSGSIDYPKGLKLSYLQQDLTSDPNRTVIEETLSGLVNLNKRENELVRMQRQLEDREDVHSQSYLKLVERYSFLNEQISHDELIVATAEKMLKGLGFAQDDLDRKIKIFSGGWSMRIELAKLLLSKPDCMLLDEPTNYLDIQSILWFEDYLRSFDGSYLVISHDQDFLDHCTNKTYELSEGNLFVYDFPYSRAMEERTERIRLQNAAHENQQKKLLQKKRTIDRFRAKASKSRMVKSMEKQVSKIDKIKIDPESSQDINIRFKDPPRSGEEVIKALKLSKNYGSLRVFEDVEFQLIRGEKVALVGKNGAGKSTLVNMISGTLNFSSGSLRFGHNVIPGYYFQNQASNPDPNKNVYEFLEEWSPAELRPRLRSILGAFLFSGDDIYKKISVLSGGERSRLSLAKLLLQPYNLLVLDEPTNHLDMPSKEILKNALLQYKGCVLLVSHDRQFLRGLTEKTLELSDGKLHKHLGDIDYFLGKREVGSFREFEHSEKSQRSKREESVNSNQKIKRNQLKTLRRKLDYMEREILALEEENTKFEKKMASKEFYQKESGTGVIKKYQENQKILEKMYSSWEELSEELLKLENN